MTSLAGRSVVVAAAAAAAVASFVDFVAMPGRKNCQIHRRRTRLLS